MTSTPPSPPAVVDYTEPERPCVADRSLTEPEGPASNSGAAQAAVVDYTTGNCPYGYGWNCKETGCRLLDEARSKLEASNYALDRVRQQRVAMMAVVEAARQWLRVPGCFDERIAATLAALDAAANTTGDIQ